VNIKEIIESGSLELYVMGALTPEETKEVDNWRKTHPEINDEIRRIEDAMIAYADSHAIKPKEDLKEKIAEKLNFSVKLDMESEMVDSVSIQMPGIYRYAAAAAIILLFAFGAGTFYYAKQYNETRTELAALKSEKSILANQVKDLNRESGKVKGELAILLKPENKKIALAGTKVSPAARAVVYWNKETGATYVNSSDLPAEAADKQYQLWAIVNGKPVDLGVISKDSSFNAMKQVANATAFAITLEPLGGKPTPTMEAMFVMGGV
jgi:anti-sigma-K factor RskA